MYNEFFRGEKERKDIINQSNVGELHSKLNKIIYESDEKNIKILKEALENMYSHTIHDGQVESFLRKIKNKKLDLMVFLKGYKQFGEFGFMDN